MGEAVLHPHSMIVAGNWKMNGTLRQGRDLVAALELLSEVQVILCPPATLLADLSREFSRNNLLFAGQDCHAELQGAYTGELSAEMLAEAGAKSVLVGHSERRQYYRESSKMVAEKARAAARAGLMPIICIGETLAERETGQTEKIIADQISESVPEGWQAQEFVLAYEPVWAIGTGKVASPEIIEQTHRYITSRLPAGSKVLYGGSVNAENAATILGLPYVDGVLVGGASLKAESFNAIIRAAHKQSEKK